jgi:hypothetical protein
LTAESPALIDHALPHMLDQYEFTVRGDKELIDNAECVVIEAADKHTIWLDPRLGYAVRKRDLFQDGLHTLTFACRDFIQLDDGLWLPRHIDWFDIGSEVAGDGAPRVRMLRTSMDVNRIELNRPEHEALFEADFAPGTVVMNMDVAESDGKTNADRKPGDTIPTVAYNQPADEADLDEVISIAKTGSPPAGRSSRWVTYFILANLILIFAIVLLILRRR